jgi:hypothetical protein
MSPDDRFSGEQAFEYCSYLTNRIGERVQGQDGAAQAKDYILEKFQEFGLETISVEAFPVLTSQQGLAQITAGKHNIAGLCFGLSGASENGGTTAPLLYLNPWELEQSSKDLPDVEGKIVLFYSRNASEQNYKTLVEAGAKGIIYVTYNPGTPPKLPSGFTYLRLSLGKETPVTPIVSVSHRDGQLLKDKAKQVTLRTDVKTYMAEGHNVLGEIPGTESEEVLLISAHYDTVPYSAGATDDAGGTAILLELARCLARTRPKQTIRFFACGAEEGALIGAQHHCIKHKNHLSEIKLNLNFDVQGTTLGNLAIGVLTNEHLHKHLTKNTSEWTPMIRVGPTGGDNKVFAWHGIPAIHWWYGGGSNFLYNHTPLDDITQISEDSLGIVGNASQHFIASLEKLKDLDFTLPIDQREGLESKLQPRITPKLLQNF